MKDKRKKLYRKERLEITARENKLYRRADNQNKELCKQLSLKTH